MHIIKRDGTEQPFDKGKIITAITKANKSIPASDQIDDDEIQVIADAIEEKCLASKDPVTVENIQDMVEDALIANNYTKLAKDYITYRYLHKLARDRYKDLMAKVDEKLMAKNVVNSNANLDEASFGGRTGETASVITREYALRYLMSDKAKTAHEDNTIYTHDLDSYSIGDHNCLTVPMDYLLKYGFNTRQTDVRPAKSLNTAFQLIAVLFQLQSLQQFGGVSAGHIDSTMVPYVRISFFKHFRDGMKYLTRVSGDAFEEVCQQRHINLDGSSPITSEGYKYFEDVYEYAMGMTERECHQGAEGLAHNLNTLQSRSGCQLPFTSINYGLDTTPEGRMVSNALLDVSFNGIGKQHRTSIFPCVIFQLKAGVNRKPGEPNYDLFLKSLKCTARRLYPNYANCDWSVQVNCVKLDRRTKADVLRSLNQVQLNQLVAFLKEHPDQLPLLGLTFEEDGQINLDFNVTPLEEMGTMGCVDGKSVIDYKIGSTRYVESFERAWNRLANDNEVKIQPDGVNEYIDTPSVSIYDNVAGTYVKQLRMIRNIQRSWCEITFTGGRFIHVTDDHPFEVEGRGVVLAKEIMFGDIIRRDVCTAKYSPTPVRFNRSAWLDGMVLCDGSIAGSLTISLGLDEKELVNMAVDEFNARKYDVNVREQHRGVKGNYVDVYVRNSSKLCNEYLLKFEGNTKRERHIPQEIFSASREDKLSFMAGMIDADGYVNSCGNAVRVQIGSVNQELAFGQLLLAKDLGLNGVIYRNHYNRCVDAIRYRVEFDATPELGEYLVCAKKKQCVLADHKFYEHTTMKSDVCNVVNVVYYDCEKYSYDVTTESEHFTVNGIYSHNCRTWNGYDINFKETYIRNIVSVLEGKLLPEHVQTSGIQKDGRGNICPVTIILPELAMEVKTMSVGPDGDVIEEFFKLLDQKIHDAKDILIERFDWIASQKAACAKFMYENNTMCGYIPEEGIRSALKHGTIVIGQLGLAECLQVLLGVDHSDPKGMELAKRIEQLYKDRCAEFKNQYKLNFGVYHSPAESLCYTAMKRFKAKWGEIPKISDHEYFTNSTHLPVWVNVTPFEKIDIESQLVGYSSAGSITYVELTNSCEHNIEALEKIVNYAMDKDVAYFAINIPNDQCLDCGYIGDAPETCSICGSDRIMRLRRVTGYLSTDYHQFNYGKQKEVEARVKHNGATL